ncbi:MAG: hypothetical protein HYS27_10150 [Deltaproteobacteria bacterium]|nr:hypothetical protein [Deltaproteobacteria bacterium]
MLRAAITALVLVAAASGCPPVRVYSERLNYAFEGTGLGTGDALVGAWTGGPVLAGSRTCGTVRCLGCKGENVVTGPANVARCLGDWSSASLVVRDRCLEFTAPGTATWALGGATCLIDGRAVMLPADQFLFTVVGADEVEAQAFLAPERLALWAASDDSYISTGAPLPDDLGRGRDVVTVVAETWLPIDVELVRRADGRKVAFDGAVRVAADPRGERVRLEPEVPGGSARLHVVDEGARATLLVDTLDGPLRAGTLRAVGEDQVAALEVTIVWTTTEEDRTHAVPAGALAFVWLADGTRADAAPVHWSVVEGAIELGDPVAGIDFVFGAPAPQSVAARRGACFDQRTRSATRPASTPRPCAPRSARTPSTCRCRSDTRPKRRRRRRPRRRRPATAVRRRRARPPPLCW